MSQHFKTKKYERGISADRKQKRFGKQGNVDIFHGLMIHWGPRRGYTAARCRATLV